MKGKEKVQQFGEQLLVRNTGTTLIHVLNGIHEIDSNVAALVLKDMAERVRRGWRSRLSYLMCTPGEDMRLQWTFWNLLHVAGIAGEEILGDHVQVKDIQEYAGDDKFERILALLDLEERRLARPLKILCVCTGNVDRSPLVEAYLKFELAKLGLNDAITVESRGSLPREGREAAPPTVKLAAEMGIDISAHRARKLIRQDVQQVDFILAMKDKHYRAITKLDESATDRTHVLHIDDPATELYLWEDFERYRDVLLQVKNATAPFLRNLTVKRDQIQANLETTQMARRIGIVDHYEELQSRREDLEKRALLIADDVLWEHGRLVSPNYMPRQIMGVLALSLLSVVGEARFADMANKVDGVFVFKRIPRLSPP